MCWLGELASWLFCWLDLARLGLACLSLAWFGLAWQSDWNLGSLDLVGPDIKNQYQQNTLIVTKRHTMVSNVPNHLPP